MIVPFAPGGPADTMARLAAQQLSTRLGQSVIIDNRGGAGGTIAAKAAAGAEPDGYTLMFGNTATFAVGPAVYANIGYDPIKNFAPIALFSVSTNLLVTDPKLPVQSVAELIAHAKANPGKINFASPGYGTPPHMIGEMFKQRAAHRHRARAVQGHRRVDHRHDGRPGAARVREPVRPGPARPRGQAQGARHHRRDAQPAGARPADHDRKRPARFRLDLVHGAGRARRHAAGDRPRLNEAINAGLHSPELGSTFAKLGVGRRPLSPEEFGAFLVRENQKWSAVARAGNIKVE